MRAIAQERRRFGYRRLHVLLRREGYLINHKKLFRLYREEKLDSAPPRRPEAGDRNQGADAGSDDAKRPVVARLCVGPTDLRPPLPHPDRR
jgi:transposase InsO family protein